MLNPYRSTRSGARTMTVCLALMICAWIISVHDFTVHADESSELKPLAYRSLLLDVARAGDARLVAVGEKGHVLLSDDNGDTWKQIKTPIRAMLTAVFFADSLHGWAVGHDSVIISTMDGGNNWELQYRAPEKEKPLLDVLFLNPKEGLAVGAYGLYLITDDSGTTWNESVVDALDDPDFGMPHINALITDDTGRLFMAGEAGMLVRSDDRGRTWTALPQPYNGSYFTLLPTRAGALIAAGLRGNIFRSEDGGDSWNIVETDSEKSIMGSCQTPDGVIVLAGLNGVVMTSRNNGLDFTLIQRPDRLSISAVLPVDANHLVIAGEGGVLKIVY